MPTSMPMLRPKPASDTLAAIAHLAHAHASLVVQSRSPAMLARVSAYLTWPTRGSSLRRVIPGQFRHRRCAGTAAIAFGVPVRRSRNSAPDVAFQALGPLHSRDPRGSEYQGVDGALGKDEAGRGRRRRLDGGGTTGQEGATTGDGWLREEGGGYGGRRPASWRAGGLHRGNSLDAPSPDDVASPAAALPRSHDALGWCGVNGRRGKKKDSRFFIVACVVLGTRREVEDEGKRGGEVRGREGGDREEV
ncbi:hypothetical protein BJ912DRAFT_925735 [Pholiota molesta]|nr:hypothetical protein BJ912DRAFT_925735 [Pholiota molesta]